MSSSVDDKFTRRQNEDGTMDSICCFCFATVGTSTQESALVFFELQHSCDPSQVERLRPFDIKRGMPFSDQVLKRGA